MIRGGRSHVSAPPAFSNDGKKLLVCTGNDVSIFSASTGLLVSALEGHAALVTSVVVEPAKSPGSKVLCYCWTAALDGTIRYWDFAIPELMKTIDIKVPIFSMAIPSLFSQLIATNNSRPDLFAYISIENMNEESHPKALHGQVRKCNLTKSSLAGLVMKETKRPPYMCMSPAGDFCSIINRRKLHMWKIPEVDAPGIAPIKIDFHHTRDLTVCAFHHTQKIVAAGDISGRILIWRGFGSRAFSKGVGMGMGSINDEGERPGVRGEDDADSCTTWHWHSTAVNVLSFSSDGAYLYSGGAEGVLVVWQLDTGKKKFLPRIGSPLLYFVDSPDPLLASVSCADNQLHFLKLPSMEILKSISGIKLPVALPKPYDSLYQSCAFDSNKGLLALRTENYAVQIYSLFDDREVGQIQICERNHQPGDEITVFVTKIAISWDGSFLSTVEVRLPEEDLGGLVCLKLWKSDSSSNQFKLSTVIYEPHREYQISALAFRPTKSMVCTTSDGGDFKTWVQNDFKPKEEKVPDSGWTCLAVGSYKKKPMTAAAFSADGSILAVAAATVVTLWDPDNNVLISVVGDSHATIKALSFVGHSGLLSVSGGSKPQLDVWSLTEFSRLWSYSLLVEGIACSDDASTFAVLALLPKNGADFDEAAFQWRDGVILVFTGTSHVPTATWAVRKAERGAISFLRAKPEEHILDGKQSKFLVAFVNGDHEYVLFDPFGDGTDEHGVKRLLDSSVEEKESFGYTSIYGNLKELELRDNKSAGTGVVPTGKDWSSIFSWPSHDPPPLTKVCSEFLESLLERRQEATGSCG